MSSSDTKWSGLKELLDTNTWIALALDTHPQHAAARRWYDAAPLTSGDLLFCRATEISFLRLLTQEQVMKRCGVVAMTNEEAIEYLAGVYRDPAVARADEPPAARPLWLQLAASSFASPNTWMDAYLAAFAIALGAEMVTFDRAFLSYVGRGLAVHHIKYP
jgi:toxin-antitoxin system PIN domain toxin